ncbi:single-stranded DNA-binding protein [Rhodothermus marinus]|uniref:single-stranded DNA-binding protein n=1 Tax=Rhodothermus marinus TaxID=29549 RepID=UPI0012BA4F7A|nr:single-stranded DNA-binding protein [Rhodothermus marinus]BBM69635.1 hypothetical protein RmaAA213_14810 [Rhodothermus marinus]BBM72617.1 hypothetical protein RmaAA338_14820 [Rhodothermus marinus]
MEPLQPKRTVNRVILLGRLAAPPEPVSEAGNVCQMVLTTQEQAIGPTGEPAVRLEPHLLQVEDAALRDFCLRHLTVGQILYVEGMLRRNEWPERNAMPVVVLVRKLLVASWDAGEPSA